MLSERKKQEVNATLTNSIKNLQVNSEALCHGDIYQYNCVHMQELDISTPREYITDKSDAI